MGDDASKCYLSRVRLRRLVSLLIDRPANRGAALSCLFAVFCLAAVVFSSPSWAHGRLFGQQEQCRLFVGPDVMNFAGYQPDSSSKREFCEDIPTTGRTIMVLDAEQPELRSMPVEIRIVKDVGGEQEESGKLDDITVAYRAPQLYPHGTINFEHVFHDSGYYVGIVTVTGGHGEQWVSSFPFSVGKTSVRSLP